MAAAAKRIGLGDEQRAMLERMVRAGTSERRMVERARIVLLAGEGRSAGQIAAALGCALGTAKKWRGRFARRGVDGLRAYAVWVAACAFLWAMRPLASWSRARWFSGFLDQRMRIERLRFSHEWQASTTQRLAPAGGVGLVLDLFAAAADVWRAAVFDGEFAHTNCVIAAV